MDPGLGSGFYDAPSEKRGFQPTWEKIARSIRLPARHQGQGEGGGVSRRQISRWFSLAVSVIWLGWTYPVVSSTHTATAVVVCYTTRCT